MLAAVCHTDQDGWTEVHDLQKVSELRRVPGNLLWAEADISTLAPSDWALIKDEFDLHDLAIEDAQNARQRPKLETYQNNLFMVFQQLEETDGQLEPIQISCFVGEGYVLTLHAGAGRTIAEVRRRWKQDARSMHRGRTYLTHLLLDVVVDDYQRIADALEDEIEEIEEQTLESPDIPTAKEQREKDREGQLQLYSVKQRVSRLRRYALPMSRVLDGVVGTAGAAGLPEETALGFRDVSDHLQRITDQIRNVDELSSAVLDLRHSEQGSSLNEINKKLTAWAAIFAVGTLIAGIYGMNFELVPADQTLLGFWFAIALMFLSGVGLYWYFRRKGWL